MSYIALIAMYSMVLDRLLEKGGNSTREWIDVASGATITLEGLLNELSILMALADRQGQAAAPHQQESQQADPEHMQGDGLSFPVVSADRVDNQADNTDDH